MTVELHVGDMLYIPQMWWQHITLSADDNLFIQFSWPSQLQTNSYLKSSSESKGCSLITDQVIKKISIIYPAQGWLLGILIGREIQNAKIFIIINCFFDRGGNKCGRECKK